MKKLLVKIKVIDQPYSPAIPAQPEKWVKDDVEVYAQPQIEVDGSLVADESYTYNPAIDEVPEQAEISHIEVIAQTQGNDDELATWLAQGIFTYPEGYFVEYVDISQEIEAQQALQQAQDEITKGIKAIATFKVQVKKKGLSQTQIAQLFSNSEINKIIGTLSTGSIPLAIALINSYQADGVIVTEEDKAAVIAALG
jgi:hypothetical protein